jgi:hypothetical protein
MYAKDLIEEGQFNVSKSDGTRIKPSEWVSQLKVISLGQDGFIEKAKMPPREDVLYEVPLGEGPYYMRIDLMNALVIAGVVMYNSNGIGKLNAMREDDGCELDESGIYGSGRVPAYGKADVLKMASELGIMANAQLGMYQIPPGVAANVIGFIFSDAENELDRKKVVVPSGFGSFVSLSKDVTGWPIEALLIDLVKMNKSDWNEEYTAVIKILLLLMMSGMCESVSREETTSSDVGYELQILGEYSNNSLAQRALSITYDTVRVQYVCKFCQFLDKQLSRIHDDPEVENIDELQRKFLLDAYNIIESPLTGSSWVINKVQQKISLLLEDMQAYKTDLALVCKLLRVKQMKINEYVDSINKAVSERDQDKVDEGMNELKKRPKRTEVITEIAADPNTDSVLDQRLYGFSGSERIDGTIMGIGGGMYKEYKREQLEGKRPRAIIGFNQAFGLPDVNGGIIRSRYNKQMGIVPDLLPDKVDSVATSSSSSSSSSSTTGTSVASVLQQRKELMTDDDKKWERTMGGNMKAETQNLMSKYHEAKATDNTDNMTDATSVDLRIDDVNSTVTSESIATSIP